MGSQIRNLGEGTKIYFVPKTESFWEREGTKWIFVNQIRHIKNHFRFPKLDLRIGDLLNFIL